MIRNDLDIFPEARDGETANDILEAFERLVDQTLVSTPEQSGVVQDSDRFIFVRNGLVLSMEAASILNMTSVKAFGAVGDGVTDDSAAFQAAINAACGPNPGGVNLQGHMELFIPPGQYLIGTPISYIETTNRKINLRIQGAGSHQATIMVGPNNTGGFLQVGVSGGNEAIYQVTDFTIVCNGQNNGTAMNLFADPVGLSRNRRFIVQNISVRPNAADGQWFNRGIVINGMYYGIVDNCSVSGPFGSSVSTTSYQDNSPAYFMDVGFDLQNCYDVTVQNCFSWSSKVGYDLSNTIDPGSEGGYMHHSGASRVLTGLKRHTIGREPGFITAFCHFNYRDSGMDLENLKDIDIVSCMIYNENASQIGTGPIPADVRLAGCQDVTITGCRFQFDACDPRRVAIWGTNTISPSPAQQHKLRNLYIRGNEFSAVNMKYYVQCDEPDNPSLNVYVLKVFSGNTWKSEAIGAGTTAVLNLVAGSSPNGWTDHTIGVWTNVVNGVTRFSQDANGRLTLTAVGSPGVTVDTAARDLVLQGTGSSIGMSILTATNGAGRIYVGSPASANAGRMSYMTDVNRWDIAASGVTTLRVGNAQLGFFGAAAASKPSVTGSRGGNAALASLITALASLGLLTDSTTA